MKKVFVLGIGGIGISALARMYKHDGISVSGSNIEENDVVEGLRSEGFDISIGQEMELIPEDTDLVVYTNALKKFAPDFLEEVKSKYDAKSYPEAMSDFTKKKRTIAISGTHGKTTTTAMLATILIDAGFKPTVIVGSILAREKSNFVAGDSEYLILEADEYADAFLNYYPEILAINNIAEDHLDFFLDLGDIQESFRELSEKVPEDGLIVTNLDDMNILPVVEGLETTIVDYNDIILEKGEVSMPGQHNILNGKVALAISKYLGVKDDVARESLKNFKGIARRFEFIGETKNGALVYDDYAHNPDKVKAAIQGAKEKHLDKKLTVVFQPHLYSRTKSLLGEFQKCFSGADKLIIAPIYAAREKNKVISHNDLADLVKKTGVSTEVVDDLEEIKDLISDSNDNDVLMFVGAGDINSVAYNIVE